MLLVSLKNTAKEETCKCILALPMAALDNQMPLKSDSWPSLVWAPHWASSLLIICCCSVPQSCLTLWDPMDCSIQVSLFIIFQTLLKLMSIESVMPSNHLILCHPLLLLPSIFPSIRGFSNELVFWIKWPKYWRFSFSTSPSNKYSELISSRVNWFLLIDQTTWSDCLWFFLQGEKVLIKQTLSFSAFVTTVCLYKLLDLCSGVCFWVLCAF